jgi:DNA-binding MarR family transcriptional regulator
LTAVRIGQYLLSICLDGDLAAELDLLDETLDLSNGKPPIAVSTKDETPMTVGDPTTKSAIPSALSPTGQPQLLHIVQRMRRAFLSICRCGDTLFTPYGITTDQYGLMLAVYREPGIRQADIGNIIFAEPNTITAMLSLLEKRGLLRRRPSPTDGRARLIYLTARGEMMTQRLSEDSVQMRRRLYECFAGARGEEALAILDRVSEEMQDEREKLAVPAAKSLLDGIDFNPLLAADSASAAPAARSTGGMKPRRVLKRARTLRAKRN